MNEIQKRQLAFFRSRAKMRLCSPRSFGKSWYTQPAKQALAHKAEAMKSKSSDDFMRNAINEERKASQSSNFKIIAFDECAEMTTEDFEKLRDHPALTGGNESIQTSKHNDWFFRQFIAAGRGSKASMAAEIPVQDEEDKSDE